MRLGEIDKIISGGRFGYTGQIWLPEVGMWYYKARMYSPTLGRFMQTDPIGYADGLNWYAYVGNDPVNAVDPLGLTCYVPYAGFDVGDADCANEDYIFVPGSSGRSTTAGGGSFGRGRWGGGNYVDFGPSNAPKPVRPEGKPQSKKLSQCMIDFLGSQGLGAPNLGDVTFHRGDGGRMAATTAFRRGHPAITLGNNIYVRSDSWSRISSPSGGRVFFEEVVHSVQWVARGTFDFGLFYALGSLMGGLATGDMHNSPIEVQAIGMSRNLLQAYQDAGSPCQD